MSDSWNAQVFLDFFIEDYLKMSVFAYNASMYL